MMQMASRSSPSTSPPLSSTGQVIRLAVVSRVCLLALVVLWRVLGRPYDTSALLNPPCLSVETSADVSHHHHHHHHHFKQHQEEQLLPIYGGSVQGWARRTLENTVVWDAVYYIRIAECGYEYEQTFAFFPLFPLCLRLVGNTVFAGLIPVVGYRATLAFSGLVLNNIAFVLAAIFLYKVSLAVLEDEKLAFQATALFCMNPASIFYVSIYSESLFSLLTFYGLWEFLRGSSWTAALLFGMSGGLRSNGILHGGFLLFPAAQEVFRFVFGHKHLQIAVRTVGLAASQVAIVLCPFVAFQIYGFFKLCPEMVGAGDQSTRPWCSAKIPYLYGFVQSHYWNVGFLRYFQLKQLPNFLLASPVLSLAVCSIAAYLRHKPLLLLTLGFYANPASSYSDKVELDGLNDGFRQPNLSGEEPLETKRDTNSWQRRRRLNGSQIKWSEKQDDATICLHASHEGFLSPKVIPFLLEMAFMAVVALFIMHVQVATRFLSVCAPIYWYAAYVIRSSPAGCGLGHLIWAVFLSYISIGSLLFVNFYPFT